MRCVWLRPPPYYHQLHQTLPTSTTISPSRSHVLLATSHHGPKHLLSWLDAITISVEVRPESSRSSRWLVQAGVIVTNPLPSLSKESLLGTGSYVWMTRRPSFIIPTQRGGTVKRTEWWSTQRKSVIGPIPHHHQIRPTVTSTTSSIQQLESKFLSRSMFAKSTSGEFAWPKEF